MHKSTLPACSTEHRHDPAVSTFPIALIGMACRFPGGASDPERFWDLLAAGRDALCEVPAERWDIRRFYDAEAGRTGKTQVREAGFLQQSIYQFDPLPFGISPREAEGLDPQQRLLLETTWESLEDAGQDLARLRGSRTGVFMGGFCLDTKLIRLSPLNREQIDQHTAASSTMTMLANRLSYIFDLRGPSISLDTACSSSLVALHQACESLRSGACDLALAGGVNVMLVPDYFLALSHARMLSPLGRSMAFDERAAGYARGEGCGVVVLKPLARALADGDTIRAVIHATGVNQDGRTQGITLPNPDAQAALIQEVYRRAKVVPGQVAYVEAHGTGTRAGDKAELETLARVMAEGRAADAPCLVGAVKTNIGHLEAASGMAGLIKTVLVLEHGQVPPNLHLQAPNPDIAWADSCLRLPDAVLPLPNPAGSKSLPYAAVNSFGYGGTNAHALLQAAALGTARASHSSAPAGPWLLPISACDSEALRALAADYSRLLHAAKPLSLADFVHSAALRRTHLPQRLAVVGEDRAALAAALGHFADGEANDGSVIQGEAQTNTRPPVFVYSGMGPQWWGMGRELARRESVFRDALAEVDALIQAQAGWSLRDALGADEAGSRVAETAVAQPANLALQVALTRLLAHWGIVPGAVVGHSIGEVAAAWSCGALSLADAVTVALRRSQYQQTLAGTGGGMLAVGLTFEGASNLLHDYPSVAIAAINAPRSLTLSGPVSDLEVIAAELDRYEVFQRRLQVEIPYHSPAMEAIREPLCAGLADIQPRAPRLPWYSTVQGALQTLPCDAHYWWKNVREPVRFQTAVECLADDGFQGFLEVGPHPVLQPSLREILIRRPGCWSASTLHRKQPESAAMLAAAAALHVRGHALNWATLATAGRPVRLPSYPWQRQHYWKESRRSREDKIGRPGATWLWQTLPAPFPAWQVDINPNFFPWLNDHRVGGRVVFPGAAYVAAALAVQHELYADAPCAIQDLAFREMLDVDPVQSRQLVTSLDREAGLFHIYSHAGEVDDGIWRLHAEGRFRPGTMPPAAVVDLDELRQRCTRTLDADSYYSGLARLGLDYGPAFRQIAGLRIGLGEVLLELRDVDAYVQVDPLPPVVLDALFQGLFAALMPAAGLPQRAMVPVAIAGLNLLAPLSGRLFAHLALRQQDDDEAVADMCLMNARGHVLATLTGVCCRVVARPRPLVNPDWCYELNWQEQPPSPLLAQASRYWLLLGNGVLPAAVASDLEQQGQRYLSAPLPADDDLAALRSALYASLKTGLHSKPEGVVPQLLIFLDDEIGSAPDYRAAWRHSLLALALAQAAGRLIDEGEPSPILCFVTRMSQSAGDAAAAQNPGGAAAWGLARVIANEIPGLLCRMIDLGDAFDESESGLLLRHLATDAVSDEVAFRQGRIYQLHLNRSTEARMRVSPALADCSRHSALTLDGRQPGNPQPFWRETTLPAPDRNQVTVELDSWLLAVAEPVQTNEMTGLEWHGRVCPTGNDVPGLAAEQHVWGLHPANGPLPIATRMRVDRDDMWPVDDPEAFPDAALPLLQAWHSLVIQGRLKKGETVLLHADSVTSPMAWAEVAGRLGAHVLVGIPEEGAQTVWTDRIDSNAVLDAARLDYREQLLARCPKGLDMVVLLGQPGFSAGRQPQAAPEAISPDAFAPGGRVLILQDKPPDVLSGRLLAAGIQLLPCRLEQVIRSRAAMSEAVAWMQQEIARGWQPQSTSTRQPVSAAAEENTRSNSATILDLKTAASIQALPASRTYCGLHRQASYLITGGTSGFGLALAEWLADQGVAHLVLVSRRGRLADADQPRLERLRTMSRVTLAAVDVTDTAAVSKLYAQLAADELPLRGVFHCAMVLADAWLRELDSTSLDRVLRPKVAGAFNLHTASEEIELDCFVLFSSVSALVGNPGQAAYAAANACLDGIAHWRRGLGLPALSVNWGSIGDVGVAARDEAILEHLRQTGLSGLHSTEALATLGVLLLNGLPQAGVFDVDWARWRESAFHWPMRLHGLATADIAEGQSALDKLRLKLSPLAGDARLDALSRDLRRQLARILRQKEEHVAMSQAVGQLGLDSLMTLEWVLIIQQEWGLHVSAVELLKSASLADLAGKLLGKILP